MLTVINNTSMKPIVTADDMNIAIAWAETVPYQNDFSVIRHTSADLSPYSLKELIILHGHLTPFSVSLKGTRVIRTNFVARIIQLLDDRVTTSETPPDAKRVASLLIHEDNEMTKKVAKKVAKKVTKKVAGKVAVKKTATKKAAPKVERVMQNTVLLPKAGSKAGQCWTIADKLAKKAGAPPKRSDVVAACVKAGLNKAGSSADFQAWRKFHGLVKAV